MERDCVAVVEGGVPPGARGAEDGRHPVPASALEATGRVEPGGVGDGGDHGGQDHQPAPELPGGLAVAGVLIPRLLNSQCVVPAAGGDQRILDNGWRRVRGLDEQHVHALCQG